MATHFARGILTEGHGFSSPPFSMSYRSKRSTRSSPNTFHGFPKSSRRTDVYALRHQHAARDCYSGQRKTRFSRYEPAGVFDFLCREYRRRCANDGRNVRHGFGASAGYPRLSQSEFSGNGASPATKICGSTIKTTPTKHARSSLRCARAYSNSPAMCAMTTRANSSFYPVQDV